MALISHYIPAPPALPVPPVFPVGPMPPPPDVVARHPVLFPEDFYKREEVDDKIAAAVSSSTTEKTVSAEASSTISYSTGVGVYACSGSDLYFDFGEVDDETSVSVDILMTATSTSITVAAEANGAGETIVWTGSAAPFSVTQGNKLLIGLTYVQGTVFGTLKYSGAV